MANKKVLTYISFLPLHVLCSSAIQVKQQGFCKSKEL